MNDAEVYEMRTAKNRLLIQAQYIKKERDALGGFLALDDLLKITLSEAAINEEMLGDEDMKRGNVPEAIIGWKNAARLYTESSHDFCAKECYEKANGAIQLTNQLLNMRFTMDCP